MTRAMIRRRLRALEHQDDDDVDPASAGFLLLATKRRPLTDDEARVVEASARMDGPVAAMVADLLREHPELLRRDGPPLRPNNKEE